MLLQTNSYVVPKEKRAEHARLVRKFRQTLGRLGCDQFDVFEQVGPNWGGGDTTGRFVQMMRFRDRKHQVAVQTAEKQDPAAQALIQEFCDLINFGYQQQQGLFAVGYYQSVLPVAPQRMLPLEGEQSLPPEDEQSLPAEPDVTHAPPPLPAANDEPGGGIVETGLPDAPGWRRVDVEKLGADDLELDVDVAEIDISEVDVSDVSNKGADQRPQQS